MGIFIINNNRTQNSVAILIILSKIPILNATFLVTNNINTIKTLTYIYSYYRNIYNQQLTKFPENYEMFYNFTKIFKLPLQEPKIFHS